MWKNIGLIRYRYSNVNNFTSNIGIKLRRIIHLPVRFMLKHTVGGKIVVDQYPKLEKNVPYIFAATHSFVDEIQVILATLDRSTYSLMGSTDQLLHNPKIYANWVTGIIYVNRCDPISRRESITKMERIINSGTSVLVFPEGGWNNTENLLCQKLFAGPYIVARRTGAKVVPVSCFYEYGKKEFYIKVGDPLDLSYLEKNYALLMLRDKMASLVWNMIEEHSTQVCRTEFGRDCRKDFMYSRLREYKKVKWTQDVWDEELTQYFDKQTSAPEQIRATFDKVIMTRENAHILSEFINLKKKIKNMILKALCTIIGIKTNKNDMEYIFKQGLKNAFSKQTKSYK